MHLKSYHGEIQKVKDALEVEKRSAHKQIAWWMREAIAEHAKLKIGDVVHMIAENRSYEILTDPEIQIFSNVDYELVYDLVYTGLRLRPNGRPYLDSQSGINRREIWQLSLERGKAILKH